MGNSLTQRDLQTGTLRKESGRGALKFLTSCLYGEAFELKVLKANSLLYTKRLEDGRFRDSGCAQILVRFLDLEVRVVHIFLCLLSRFEVLPFIYQCL